MGQQSKSEIEKDSQFTFSPQSLNYSLDDTLNSRAYVGVISHSKNNWLKHSFALSMDLSGSDKCPAGLIYNYLAHTYFNREQL